MDTIAVVQDTCVIHPLFKRERNLTSGKSITIELTDGLTVDFDAVNQGTYTALNGIKLTMIGEGFVQGEIDINSSLKNPTAICTEEFPPPWRIPWPFSDASISTELPRYRRSTSTFLPAAGQNRKNNRHRKDIIQRPERFPVEGGSRR